MKSKTVQSEAPPAVAVQRIVSVRLDKTNSLGAWEIICDDCPLKPHLEALGMKAKACSAGIQTNVQGAVPLAQCEHYEKDSIKSEGKKLTLMCRKHANAADEPQPRIEAKGSQQPETK